MNPKRLSDRDLLTTLIGSRATHKLYTGTLASLFDGERLLGPGHEKLLAAKELITRALYEKLERDVFLSCPQNVRLYLLACFIGQPYESFFVLYLDAQNRLIASEEMFRGSLSQTAVHPREIVKGAMRHNAAGLIFAHNHPSGVAEPSRADELLTQSLKQALSAIDVRVLDHFVVSGGMVVSMAERGMV